MVWSKIGKADHNREKQAWKNEKSKLDNARRLRENFFLDPSDEESKEIIKSARKKLEISMEPAMPCERKAHLDGTRKRKLLRNPNASQKVPKTEYGCIVGSHESTRPRAELSQPKHHEYHILGKVFTSLTHCNLVHRFIPIPQAKKNPDAKAAVDKEWKKLETIPAWQLYKLRSKKEDILEAQRDKKKVHFASLMDICHLKNAELEPQFQQFQQYKGRAVLRGDIVNDDSGSYAVFTEQGSSASQMSAAQRMDVIARLPDCDGQAADAVSAYTQVKLEDAPKLLRIPKSECPDVWLRIPRQKWPTSWANIEDPVVLLERNLYGHPSADLLWERQFGEVLFGLRWEKAPNCECLFVNRKQGLFLSVHVDDIKMVGKKQNMSPMWKNFMKVNANQMKATLNSTQRCLNHVLLLEQLKITRAGKSAYFAKTVAWSYVLQGHARKCVDRYCEEAEKKVGQLYKVSSPCLDDHQFKKEELQHIGEFSEVW